MKEPYVAALLAGFLGTFGAHYFYIGKHFKGILCLVLCFTGIPTIWGFYKCIRYATMSRENFAKECGLEVEDLLIKNPEYCDAELYLCGVNGQLYVYDNRIIIERKGVMGFTSQAFAGGKTIPMKSITTIQFKDPSSTSNGFIQFGLQGAIESSGGLWNAVDDENSILFTKDSLLEARQIKKFIESKIY